LACDIKKQLDVNVCSFGHLAPRLSLHYLVKCRSCRLTIDNNEFIRGSALLRPQNHWKSVVSSLF